MNTETKNQETPEVNFWSAADILCQAVEAAQTKGVYNLKDAALLSKCVDVVRDALKQVADAEAAKNATAQPTTETENV